MLDRHFCRNTGTFEVWNGLALASTCKCPYRRQYDLRTGCNADARPDGLTVFRIESPGAMPRRWTSGAAITSASSSGVSDADELSDHSYRLPLDPQLSTTAGRYDRLLMRIARWLLIGLFVFAGEVGYGQGTAPTFRYKTGHGAVTLPGRDPAQNGTTVIPTMLVPVRLQF